MSTRSMAPYAEGAAAGVLSRVFARYPGTLDLELWNGRRFRFGAGAPRVGLVIRDARAFRDLLLFRDPLRLARDYFVGRIDVEGSIYDALMLKQYLEGLRLPLRDRVAALADALFTRGPRSAAGEAERAAREAAHRNSPESIAFHYDVSNAFYALWLDPEMVYSCAYFTDPANTLEQAQRDKLDLICRKLELVPGQRLLDIGCGWGSLVLWAARHYGVSAHGITLSARQRDYARERIAALGLADRVTVELRDYRDLPAGAKYDKIASVGMFEHVGLENLPAYFDAAHRVLAPGGLFLNHGITSREGGWEPTTSARFINRYVFPDGELDSISGVQRVMEDRGFEVRDVHALRPHYALTLRHWVRRLEAQREAAVREAGEQAYRIWRLYMAGCALQFEQGETGIYQILLAKAGRPWDAPLTRAHMEA